MPNIFLRRATSTMAILMLCLAICLLTACGASGGGSGQQQNAISPTTNDSAAHVGTVPAGALDAPPTGVTLGAQDCPAPANNPQHWEAILKMQPADEQVENTTCASLTGSHTLQALITARATSSGGFLDFYIYDNITSTHPTRLFQRQSLEQGNAKISHYNTILTSEIDANSSINAGQIDANMQTDLYHEFKWSATAKTFLPVAFPGIYPDLTRYQAENTQQQASQGNQAWHLNVQNVASNFSSKFLKWSNPAVQVVSGGGQQDVNAVVNVKNSGSSTNGLVTLTLSRLEGNTNGGIWEVISASSSGLAIITPQSRSQVHSPCTISGKGLAFEAVIGTVAILDHLYNTIGQTQARGVKGNGPTSFTSTIAYKSTAQGSEEGVVTLTATSQADGSISGLAMHKVLLLD